MPAEASAPLFRGAKCFVFGFTLGDDVVGDFARAGGVVAELHRELAMSEVMVRRSPMSPDLARMLFCKSPECYSEAVALKPSSSLEWLRESG